MTYYCGVDWGSAAHAFCVVDDQGKIVVAGDLAHSKAGLRHLMQQLAKLGLRTELAIAIERPDGVLVDSLLEEEHPVVALHPNVVRACRSRYQAASAKSDAADAYMLADILRTDGHRFSPLKPLGDNVRALRAMVRSRSQLVEARVALVNQLDALLDSYWPGAKHLFSSRTAKIALSFLEHYSTPAEASELDVPTFHSFLKANGYNLRQKADELLAKLHAAPTGLAGPLEAAAKGALVRGYVVATRAIVEQIDAVTKKIESAVMALPAGRVMTTFPRAGRLNAAQIVAEIGDITRYQSEAHLAAEAGVAPVTKASGRYRNVTFRFACNKHLRSKLTLWADNSRRASPWADDIYQRAKRRGCRHPHAIRILARAWIRVLWPCLKHDEPYQLARHRAAERLSASQAA